MCANQNLKPKIVASIALNKVRIVFNYFNGMLIILTHFAGSTFPQRIECKVEVHQSHNQHGNNLKDVYEMENCFEIFEAVKNSKFSTSVKDLVKEGGGSEPEVKILKIRKNLQIESFENCFGPYIKPP